MKLYSIDVPIWATAYIKANSEEEAREKYLQLADGTIEVEDQPDAEVPISGKRFEDPNLPDVSLSPAMTIASREVLQEGGHIELVEEEIEDAPAQT